MHQSNRRFLLAFLLCFSPLASASVVMPGDGPYYRLDGSRTLYIYDDSARDVVDEVQAYNEAIRAFYDQSYGWELDEREDLILTSPRQQVANAYATVVPNIKTVWYPSGAGMVEDMADSSWMISLATHETAHLYQLNAKGKFPAALKKFFGNPFVIFPIALFPIFIHPNLFTPTFLVEGNAVLMESRINMGGRLHSGEKRALVLAQIAAGDITPTSLINDEFRFPYGEEAYLQGGYFQAHLASKYGLQKTNQFFRAQGEHFLWPFILNKTFRSHFGNSYPQEIREYVRSQEGLAKNQQSTPGPSLINTTFTGPMNHDENKVFFLTTTGKEPPFLHEYDKKMKAWTKRQLDLLSGKVFFDEGRVLTAASDTHDLHHQEYSLFGEGAAIDPRFKGQIVTDRRAGKTVALDAGAAWLDPRVLVNGENYDVAHSSAILDNGGNIYYFRQNGAEKILYRNREPLFKFDGFFAKPMEVTQDGTFYFIANTDYGSTLYQWRGREVARVLKSDRVVDARSIGENEFLVTEVNARGHNVLIAKAELKSQPPALYSYGFPTQSLIPQKVTDQDQVRRSERTYNSFRELRYSSLDLMIATSSDGGMFGSAVANFTDPLEYQGITVGVLGENHRSQVLAQYEFTKYLPDFFLRYFYNEDTWREINLKRELKQDVQGTAGMSLPIWRWHRWDAEVGLALNYKKADLQKDSILNLTSPHDEETYGTLTSAKVKYAIEPRLGFLPWRQFTFGFSNKLEALSDGWRKKYNTSLVETSWTHGFPKEIFATLKGSVAWAEHPNILVSGGKDLSREIRVDRLTWQEDDYYAKTASTVRFEVQKAFDSPAYSARIPIGINRLSPVAIAQGIFLDDDHKTKYPANTFEWAYGIDVELLLIHRAPARIRIIRTFDTQNGSEDLKSEMNFKTTF